MWQLCPKTPFCGTETVKMAAAFATTPIGSGTMIWLLPSVASTSCSDPETNVIMARAGPYLVSPPSVKHIMVSRRLPVHKKGSKVKDDDKKRVTG